MNDYTYILIITFLTLLILLYGGHNNQKLVEYDYKKTINLEKLILFEKKLQIYNNSNFFKDKDYINIEEYMKTFNYIIPNILNIYFINVKPYSFYTIDKIFKENLDENIMIIFNHNKVNNLELFIGYDKNNYGFFYDLEKTISITSIYNIYNNSDLIINITLFFIKKPYWFI